MLLDDGRRQGDARLGPFEMPVRPLGGDGGEPREGQDGQQDEPSPGAAGKGRTGGHGKGTAWTSLFCAAHVKTKSNRIDFQPVPNTCLQSR